MNIQEKLRVVAAVQGLDVMGWSPEMQGLYIRVQNPKPYFGVSTVLWNPMKNNEQFKALKAEAVKELEKA